MSENLDELALSKPMAAMSTPDIVRMIKGQLDREFDRYRMVIFWRRLLESPTDKKVIAEALCLVLSSGVYAKKSKQVDTIFNISVTAQGSSEDIAKAVAGACEQAISR